MPDPQLTTAAAQPARPDSDPWLWLEEVQGERALQWARARNAVTRERLQAWPEFGTTRDALRAILDSRERIPAVARRGDWFYNFWQDAANPRGLLRRATLEQYRQREPKWETVLDLDALAKQEGENWVWGGANCFGPSYRRCMLSLSRGGADAKVMREFDVVDQAFVPGGFGLPEAKSSFTWIDADTAYVSTDFGPGSMTDSGYPRVVKRWRRGQPLGEAQTVFEGQVRDVSAWVWVDRTPGFERTVFGRSTDFWNTSMALQQGGKEGSQLLPLPKPADAQLSFWRSQVLVNLKSAATVGGRSWPAGTLLAGPAEAYLAAARAQQPREARASGPAAAAGAAASRAAAALPDIAWTPLFTPTASRSLRGWTATRSTVVLSVLEDVSGRLEEQRLHEGAWTRREVRAPSPGTLSVQALHDPLLAEDPLAEAYLLNYADFLTPDSLLLGRTGSDTREPLKARPAFFDAAGMRVEQHFATSKDGTRVPYFVVWPRGAVADGTNPTLLYGYGGFRVPQLPWYSAAFGTAWYSRGGVLVVANIRGGGEYGPAWHQAAVKADKQKSYDDFAAVAEDLITRRITSPRHLGIQGGSNGGLLVGAVMLQRPELFGAVVCSVPLLDMRRYHRLLAGASWMAEYGDPDKPEEWAFISRYSPYQNVRADMKLPPVLFTTSTRDDRVHPGHARKMAARMLEQGHPALYFENMEGGHGGAADNAQRADLLTLEFAFLWQELGPRHVRLPAEPARSTAR
jgi:prolyl oligopeptidase